MKKMKATFTPLFYLIVYVLCLVGLLAISVRMANAQNPRDLIDGEFIGLETTLVYLDDSGNIQVEPYKTRVGRIKRGERGFSFDSLVGNDLSLIPGVGLVAEHWWLSFELNMMTQRDYGICVDLVNEYRRFRGACELDDPLCDYFSALFIRTVRDYWVPFNIQGQHGVPTREEFLLQLEAGIASLNVALAARDACEQTLRAERVAFENYLIGLRNTVTALAAENKKLKKRKR